MKRMAMLGATALLPAMLAGCFLAAAAAVGAAGYGAYSYVKGEAIQEYDASLVKTWNAAVRTARNRIALNDVRGTAPDGWKASLSARRPSDGIKVTVTLDRLGPNKTRVGVRFGTFGDQAASKHFHDVLATELR